MTNFVQHTFAQAVLRASTSTCTLYRKEGGLVLLTAETPYSIREKKEQWKASEYNMNGLTCGNACVVM